MSSNLDLKQAVSLGLGAAGAAAASMAFAPLSFAAPAAAGPNPDTAPENALDEVVVTGSRLRRVDAETASPVMVIDSQQIQESGITQIGDLVQRIPSVSGQATNPNVNNGGGYGESNIELRGLDAKRTLILVDGHRIGFTGTTSDATDVNQIPLAMIERVEVLKDGAGAIYGSDAIGGVVNFITRKDVDGLEISGDYGRTTKNDGAHHAVNLVFGTSTDKFNFMMGGTIMEQDAVSAGNRSYSKYALYLYGGTTGAYPAGSSRVPTGRIFANPTGITGADGTPCSSLTRVAGASGATVNPSNYRCYTSGDAYNYEPLNLLTTPIERTSFFSKASYKINEDLEAYSSVTYTHTHSGYHAAPLPFDSLADGVVLSKNSIYNPFGTDFGGLSGANPNFTLRLTSVGSRYSDTTGDGADFNGGIKGKLLNTDWTWDLNLTYSRLQQHAIYHGYYFGSQLANALGPSFYDPATGAPTCGTLTQPISGCTPINFFDQTAATNAAALSQITTQYNLDNVYVYKAANLDFAGKLLTLPAGDMQLAVGFTYDDRHQSYVADALVQAQAPLYLGCQLSQETCTGNTEGGYNSKQEYGELLVPILKDLPLVNALNLDIGVRHQDYQLFGSSTKLDFKVEYRPIKDILVRGTVSQVLRVPTVSDIAAAPLISSVTFNDPCTGLTPAAVAGNPNLAKACVGVPLDGTFKEANGQITGLNKSNPNLKPETGLVKTGGVVWDPSFVPGLSIEGSYWAYRIDGLITQLDSNYSAQQCVATGDPTYCSYILRYGAATPNAGIIEEVLNPSVNLGTLKTSGLDFGLHYSMKNTPLGSWNVAIDWSHTNNYTITQPGAATQEIAGTFNRQFGNYAKNRGLMTLGWSLAGFDALITERYIGSLKIENPSVTGFTADGSVFPDLQIGSVVYTDLTVGYTFPTRTRIQAGVNNLSDKQPPIMYLNNVSNANTDVNTYDTIGRRWFVGFSQKL